MSCIFCKIIRGEIPADIVAENDSAIAIRDIQPVAPIHILIVPKIHVETILSVDAVNSDVLNAIVGLVQSVAGIFNLSGDGFRVVTNVGKDGGQAVNHLHFHVLGGRQMTWPPG